MSISISDSKVPRCLFLLGLIILFGGCTQQSPIHIRVASGSSARALTISLQAPDSLSEMRGLRVALSRLRGSRGRGTQGHILWSVAAVGAHSRQVPRTVVYGTAPTGFTASVAEGLVPGRYEIEILRDGPSDIAFFAVQNDGSISQ